MRYVYPILLALLVPPAVAQSTDDCLTCHSQNTLTMTRQGKEVSLFVDGDAFKKSPHALLSCVGCHSGFQPFDIPHAADVQPLPCQTCHDMPGFAAGVHGKIACTGCHGAHDMLPAENPESRISRINEPKLCLSCHLDDPKVRRLTGVSAEFMSGYSKSVHGTALAGGNASAATCSDCHGAHDPKKSNDPASLVSKWNSSATCGRCHQEAAKAYNESIHGTALKSGIADAPSCTDCHGQHEIYAPENPRSRVSRRNLSEEVCAGCHNSVALNQKYGLPTGRFSTFYDSYHGLASRAGSVEVANCASCHGVHNIKPSSDPTSTVNRNNLSATCGHCHPGANENFARGAVHVIPGSGPGGGILNWIRGIYIVLIVVVIGGMFLHNFLDFLKKARHRLAVRHGGAAARHYSSALYVRMTLNERIQHAVMFISFILLAVTGFMLRYPDSWWVIPIRQASDKFFEVRGVLHRIAGVAMIAISLYHLFYIYFTRRGKRFVADVLPGWKDVRDLGKNLRYLVGFSKSRPRFDRFGYVEKAEYWALVWGVLIMAATGIILWFDNYFMGLLTKLGWDIARTIHFYEAVLATLAIVVWHFYFVIFNPDVYPMSFAWLTGKISEEEMAEEHPLELERLKK